ncbi:P-loop containing nucleoside triphosphate hydrolase protein, partial [Pavlovales sp. CCMP2436]
LSDATHLLNLTDDSVVDNLGIRYAADEIHTFVGTVLLVLNPYRKLPIYEEPERFYGVRLVHAPPHVFAVGEEAYLLLRREGVSQALVISGQSGAGKTETTKLLVRYIAE